jgi:hypothetical protein
MPMPHSYVQLVTSAQVRAYLDAMIVEQPDVFERMALREIRRLRPRLQDGEALSVAYDAVLAVIALAARTPVALSTVLGLVNAYVHWAALDRLRQLAPGGEPTVAADVPVPEAGGSLMEDLRAASQLRVLDRIGARTRAAAGGALADGRLRLGLEDRRVLNAAVAREALNAADRKRLERARAAIVAWVRSELVDDGERRLLTLLLGDGLADRERRSREPDLVRVLGLDQVIGELPVRQAAPGRARTDRRSARRDAARCAAR